ncbi:hypothetical protein P5673_005686 [Acropora cervicornis]|uniref:Uncharacterized protein n=1 Tax=Acropora cervicornis TaxID=6130 RepID=A0AAD9QYM9_ACRCE|nr:hypothetical protein P5673_005686 [Acropora cervicornis]
MFCSNNVRRSSSDDCNKGGDEQQDLKAACKGEDSPVLAQVSVALRDTERARTPLKVEYRLWSDFLYDA